MSKFEAKNVFFIGIGALLIFVIASVIISGIINDNGQISLSLGFFLIGIALCVVLATYLATGSVDFSKGNVITLIVLVGIIIFLIAVVPPILGQNFFEGLFGNSIFKGSILEVQSVFTIP